MTARAEFSVTQIQKRKLSLKAVVSNARSGSSLFFQNDHGGNDT